MRLRRSHHLSRKAATTLLHSPRTAVALGRPFNLVVCISTWALGIEEQQASDRFRQMRRTRFGRWSSRRTARTGAPRNGTPTDTWVFEAPNGRHHVHWMLHIRPKNQDDFEAKLVRWVREMAGLPKGAELPEGALHIAPAPNPEGKKLYMAKGLDPHLASRFRIDPVDSGIIYGRRADTARALGPSVWQPLKAAWRNAQRRPQSSSP
jgi:hypothetical protein